jgi:hypothetical protein
MKFYLTLFFIVLSLIVKAQVKEFIVVDSLSNKPINAVSVYLTARNEGAVSNGDGKVKVFFANQKDKLLISHVAYNPKEILIKDYLKVDTIRLSPSSILLMEVAVYDLDLKKKLAELLENYEKFYLNQAVIYDCTYKESVKVNDTLARLSQVQLKWHDKNYRFDFRKPYDKQNQLSLINIDYSKLTANAAEGQKGYVENESLFKLLHLNFYTLIVSRGEDIIIQSINKTANYTKVVFSTPILEKGETVMFLNDGIIYFDNETGAIIELDFSYEYNNQIKKMTPKTDGKTYTSEVKKHHVNLSFKKVEKKWVINAFKSVLEGEFNINNKKDDFKITQEFLITKTKNGTGIPKKEQIDLKIPFYKNLAQSTNLDSKIPLTKEEEEFMKKK